MSNENTPPDFATLVPAEYKDKPYMQGVNSVDLLFKKLDGSQKALGAKPFGIPDDTAKDDAWNEFHGKLRPATSKDYEFADIADYPEEFKRDDVSNQKLRDIFHNAGLSKRQAGALQKQLDEFSRDTYSDYSKKTQQAMDTEFTELTTKAFGAEAEKKLGIAKDLLKAHIPAEYLPWIDQLDNKQLTVMGLALNSIHEKHLSEDTNAGNGGSGGGGSKLNSVDAINTRLLDIRKEWDKYSNIRMHPNFAALQAEEEGLWKKKVQLGG